MKGYFELYSDRRCDRGMDAVRSMAGEICDGVEDKLLCGVKGMEAVIGGEYTPLKLVQNLKAF